MRSRICTALITALCLSTIFLPPAAMAQDAMSQQNEGEVIPVMDPDPVVVVASRLPQPLSEVAAQVTVINAADIEKAMVEDLDGLTAYLPGLDTEVSGSRFGASGINLRGIGGNRVEIEQDGIPTHDRYALGAFSDSGRGMAEVDLIKRIEVLHGPASVMYGSNAIGGVVAITTWDPDDLLRRGDGQSFYSVRGGYRSVDDSWVGTGLAAWGQGAHGLMLTTTYREGHERDNQASGDVASDPQDWDGQDVMLRYTFDTVSGARLRLTASDQQRDTTTQILSLPGYGRQFRNTTRLVGIDDEDSNLLSLDYEFSWGGWQRGVARVFRTDSDVEQLTLEERGLLTPPVSIRRKFKYSQERTGLDLNLFRQTTWGDTIHNIGIGMDWLSSDSSELRDGLQTNLDTGDSTHVILGEEFPLRDFPESTTDELGLFIQDEIRFVDSRWTLVPALRWDRYELDPQPDEIWLDDFPDTEVVSVDESQWTPRMGIIYDVNDEWTVYGQYAAGFRAPPFEDANIGLEIPMFRIRAIPNPDLESETSDGYELGLRHITANSSFNFAVFQTDYDDFIDSRALVGVDPATGFLLFQSVNIDRARIRGFDVRFEQSLDAWHDALDGWYLHAAAYWAEGENRVTGEPLNSIAPPQGVIGLSWSSPGGDWDLGLTGVFTAAKDESDIDSSNGERFATDGWSTIDLTAGWRASDWLELRAGVFNLGDKTYWRWLDVENLAPNDPMIPILSQPGRNYSVTARIAF